MPNDDDAPDARGDTTPMIDIIFLLLIFFILTTEFIPEEKIIGAVLPTEKGQRPDPKPMPPDLDVALRIYPAGLRKGMSELTYADEVARLHPDGVRRYSLCCSTNTLTLDATDNPERQLAAVTAFVGRELARLEQPGLAREDQFPVGIHCYSALPWRIALWTYDAVRHYERDRGGAANEPDSLATARTVSFAPPLLRAYDSFERSRELYHLVHQH